MFDFLHTPEFVLKRSKNEPHLFGNVGLTTPTWDDIFANLNSNIAEDRFFKVLDGGGFVTHDAESIPHCGGLLEQLRKVDDRLPALAVRRKYTSATAHCYISITAISKTFGAHKDNADVWFWQCTGTTRWTVYDRNDKEVIVHDLKPGEMVYIPRGLMHKTQPLTSRAGISFGLNY